MRILAVAHLTLTELWRQKTQWGFIVLALLLVLPAIVPLDGITSNGAALVGPKLAEAFLAFAQFVAVFLAISAASGLVANDLERGTGLMVLSKPLWREQILFGKLLGAAVFMSIAWIGWGLIAGAAFSFRMGGALFMPTFLGFAGSMVASWLVVAFCLFWSCWLPANAVVGLAVLGWILASAAPEVAEVAASAGYSTVGRVLAGLGELLPIGKLSDAAKQLITGESLQPHVFWSTGLIFVWWFAAALIFSNRDLATSG